MSDTESTSQATADIIAVKIYTHSEKYRTPLTRQNYSVWYEYFEGKNHSLNFSMDALLKDNTPLTPAIMQDLYKKYVDNETTNLMSQIQEQTQKLLQEVLRGVGDTTDSSSLFEKNLTTLSAGLTRVSTPDQAQIIIGAVLKETRKMAEAHQKLQKDFEQAKAQSRELSQKLQQIEEVAAMDALTGLYNRRSFDREVSRLIKGHAESGTIFSAIILDIDHFKRFNDIYGHQIGDDVLRIVGQIIKKGVKGGDIPTRYGGEEFVILLPDTDLRRACIVAEQLRIRIAVLSVKIPGVETKTEKITVSLGVAEINGRDDAKSVIDRADKAMYLAKNSGRNNTKNETDI
ncbi:MAG: GGDEF domain-containing protein [Pseudomonadota bacterium]